MKELTKIAEGYYRATTNEVRKSALEFFNAMDDDGDGKIDKMEFIKFMRDQGYYQMKNSSFFNQLDLDGNGTLDFNEVRTLYYIVKSGRPFCDFCDKFITSTYFKCVGCLEEDKVGQSFYQCLDCYLNPKCIHTHKGLCRFLDNYTLLEAMGKSKLSEVESSATRSKPSSAIDKLLNPRASSQVESSTTKSRPSSAIDQLLNQHPSSPGASSRPPQNVAPTVNNYTTVRNNTTVCTNYYSSPAASTAIVPYGQQRRVSTFELLNKAVAAINIGTALSSCSIL
ncbi:uncharacterized protein [Rutidosis leptorrhynchoides]|uniref:uncharacterized protein n=1 Tax=Rutidosis leptorrhynchoides TaxID=125765 RepID=UPI003A991A2F